MCTTHLARPAELRVGAWRRATNSFTKKWSSLGLIQAGWGACKSGTPSTYTCRSWQSERRPTAGKSAQSANHIHCKSCAQLIGRYMRRALHEKMADKKHRLMAPADAEDHASALAVKQECKRFDTSVYSATALCTDGFTPCTAMYRAETHLHFDLLQRYMN